MPVTRVDLVAAPTWDTTGIRILWIVGLVALVARLAAALALDGLRHPHLEEYDQIAQNLLAGRGFTFVHLGTLYRSFCAPLMAWLIAASHWLVGSVVLSMLLQVVAGAALAVVTAILSRRLFGGWPAPLAAGLLVALHPGLVVYAASRSHPLTYDALFFILVLFLGCRLGERPDWRRAAQFGLVVGVGALSRGTTVVFLPIVGAWLLVVSSRAVRGRALGSVFVAGLCAAVVIAPWTIRNYVRLGRFVFMQTTGPEVFWRGNNPWATGNSFVDPQHTVLGSMPPDLKRDLERQPDELAQAAWFQNQAMTFIRANPRAFVRLTLSKFGQFWSFSPHTGLFYPRAWLWTYLAYYALVVALAAVGLWQLIRAGDHGRSFALLVVAFLLALSSLQSLYYVEGRHRWAVEPILMALSGGAAAVLDRRRDAFDRATSRTATPA